MKPLSLGVALFGLLALVLAEAGEDVTTAVLGVIALLCAYTDIPFDRDIELSEDIRRHLLHRDHRLRPRGARGPGVEQYPTPPRSIP